MVTVSAIVVNCIRNLSLNYHLNHSRSCSCLVNVFLALMFSLVVIAVVVVVVSSWQIQ